MNFIIKNWYIIIAVIAVLAVAIVLVVRFLQKPTSEQLSEVKEWLLYATTLAEKELGSGTGKLKLRYVYDMFVSKFPWVAKILEFDTFSNLVDEALASMNQLLSTNTAVQEYVNGKTADTESEVV